MDACGMWLSGQIDVAQSSQGRQLHRLAAPVLVTCKGAPILIGKRDERGRYRIPLVQEQEQGAPRLSTKTTHDALHQANSVYDLPFTEQVIRWMHAVCGFPVKSTWLKAVKAGNYIGWPLITTKNVTKYYPDSVETPKGHLNQTRKNVRSTKPTLLPRWDFFKNCPV